MNDLSRLKYLLFAAQGNTKAHAFIHNCGTRQLTIHNINTFIVMERARVFIPNNDYLSRIIIFSDNSGVEVIQEDEQSFSLDAHFLGTDISSWISHKNYEEIKTLNWSN